jgi:hypothetical protein
MKVKPSEYLPSPEEQQPQQRPLPPIEDASELVLRELPEPAELVEDLLHRGSKLVLGGSSKSNKTWCLVDLALSVAFGEPWLSCKTRRGRVLYINLEIQAPFFRNRLKAVAAAKGIKLEPGHLDVWNLRGYAAPHAQLFEEIRKGAADRQYVLIVIDPIYKVYGGLRENDAGDVASMLDRIEKLAVEIEAAVAFGAHFSKGNQAAKEAIDRISGSGVFARDPDSILVMTAHEEERCFTVEATLRNFKPLEPFVIRWDYPVMRRDDSLNPRQLKQAKGGRKTMYTADGLLELLPDEGATSKDWKTLASEETGMGRSTFFELRAELEGDGRIKGVGGKWFAMNGSPESPETH